MTEREGRKHVHITFEAGAEGPVLKAGQNPADVPVRTPAPVAGPISPAIPFPDPEASEGKDT